jgi:hypothetical protein
MKDEEAMIFDSIKSGIRFQKSIADGWIKVDNPFSNFSYLTCFFDFHDI